MLAGVGLTALNLHKGRFPLFFLFFGGRTRTKLMKLTFTVFPPLLFANQRMVQAQLHHHHADGSSHSAQHVEGHQWAERQQKKQHPQHVMKEKVLAQPRVFAVLFWGEGGFSLLLTWLSANWKKTLLLLQLLMCADWITWLPQGMEYAKFQMETERNLICEIYDVREGKSLHDCLNAECFNALNLSNILILLLEHPLCHAVILHFAIASVFIYFICCFGQTNLFFFFFFSMSFSNVFLRR